MDFRLPDTYFDPPEFYFWVCDDCPWFDENQYFPEHIALEEKPACCDNCGSEYLSLEVT